MPSPNQPRKPDPRSQPRYLPSIAAVVLVAALVVLLLSAYASYRHWQTWYADDTPNPTLRAGQSVILDAGDRESVGVTVVGPLCYDRRREGWWYVGRLRDGRTETFFDGELK